MPSDENDWIFDFVLQFLESDKFDAAVMNFVDEKCDIFDSEEENKFAYTDIHREFREHIDALVTSSLGELGITVDMFFDACEHGRNNRDINKTVFERMTAMDDFQTFKTIMVKRNMELQLEAIRSYRAMIGNSSKYDDDSEDENEDMDLKSALKLSMSPLPDPENLKRKKDAELEEFENQKDLQEVEMQEILHQSLMEMELMHRQQELEHLEVERAIALSVQLEEERLRLMRAEEKRQSSDDSSSSSASASAAPVTAVASSSAGAADDVNSDNRADAKSSCSSSEDRGSSKGSSASSSSSSSSSSSASDKKSSDEDFADVVPVSASCAKNDDSAPVTPAGKRKVPSMYSPAAASLVNIPDPKPLKVLSRAPLPGIRGMGGGASQLADELQVKCKIAEESCRINKQEMAVQRQKEDEIRQQLKVDPSEAEQRAKHMRDQRDRIIAAKKLEREKKVSLEEEQKSKLMNSPAGQDTAEGMLRAQQQQQQQEAKTNGGPNNSTADNITEQRRAAMRMALARRMKMDLLESEETRLVQMQEEQFADLDRKLQQVEQIRQENRQREQILTDQLRKQQNTIARNIKYSAASLSNEKEDD